MENHCETFENLVKNAFCDSIFRKYNVESNSFIWVTSKYFGSCWFYRRTMATLLYQTTHSASNEPYFKSLGETFVK